MNDYDNLKSSGKIDETYGSLKAAREVIDVTTSSSEGTVKKEQYEKLAEKFEEAMKLIEVLRSKINELESNKMPSKGDVESMSAMLDLLGKLDTNSINRLNKLGKMTSSDE